MTSRPEFGEFFVHPPFPLVGFQFFLSPLENSPPVPFPCADAGDFLYAGGSLLWSPSFVLTFLLGNSSLFWVGGPFRCRWFAEPSLSFVLLFSSPLLVPFLCPSPSLQRDSSSSRYPSRHDGRVAVCPRSNVLTGSLFFRFSCG